MKTVSDLLSTKSANGSTEPAIRRDRMRTVVGRLADGTCAFPFDGRDDRAAEQYRIARTKIIQHPCHPSLLAVSSPQLGDGKSTTALNLAGALALKDELSVLLVDADLRRSSLHGLLNLPPSPGLEQVLSGECPLEEAIVRVELTPSFYFLPAGGTSHHPSELLAAPAWREVCETMRRSFDYVVFDTPPAGLVADYELIQSVVDGVILVMRLDHTNRSACLEALQLIPREKFLGIITNCTPEWMMGKRPSYSYYSYKRDGVNN